MASGVEHKLRSIRRPFKRPYFRRLLYSRQIYYHSPYIAAVGVHHINSVTLVRCAYPVISIAKKSDLSTIRRPFRIDIVSWTERRKRRAALTLIRQLRRIAAI